jgi:hypothetical protein
MRPLTIRETAGRCFTATDLRLEFYRTQRWRAYSDVNDAIAAIRFLRPYKAFYDNNTGAAKVTIKRLDPP